MCNPDGFIKFAGMILSSKGLSPDPDKMSVIQDFPITVSRSNLGSWLGLCQQLSMWYLELASCQSGLWHLVRDYVVFHWSVEMTEQMEATKQLICGDVYVQPYDTMLVHTILVDCSILYGTGFILVQKYGRFFAAEDYKNCDDVIETTVDGDVSLTLQSDSDVKLSEGEGGDISPTTEVGETSSTLKMSGDGVVTTLKHKQQIVQFQRAPYQNNLLHLKRAG